MGLAAHFILLDRTEWNSSLSPNRHCLIRLFLPSKSFRPFRSPSRRAGGSLRSLLTVNGEGMPPPPGAKKINGFVHDRLMTTSFLRRVTNHLRKNRHDCRRPMARREILLRYSRYLAALRDCHRRSERCGENRKDHPLVELQQAAAY